MLKTICILCVKDAVTGELTPWIAFADYRLAEKFMKQLPPSYACLERVQMFIDDKEGG